MENPAIGEILILFLLILICGRVFFVRYGKVDVLTVLAPLCVVLSVLQIIAWNADFFSVLLLLLSLLTFFMNFWSLVRFVSGLYISNYTKSFIAGAWFIIFMSAAELAVLLVFYPVNIRPADFKAVETRIRLKGSFSAGFSEAGYIPGTDAVLHIYEPEDKISSKNHIIMFIPDKRSDTLRIAPYLLSLAQLGYTVYSCDFYAPDLKWFHSPADSRYLRRTAMLVKYFMNPRLFQAEKEFFTYNIMQECSALLDFAESRLGRDSNIFLVCDAMADTAAADFYAENQDRISGLFKLDSISEYKTPGLGCVEQTDPVIAYTLNLKRSSDFSVLKYMAAETAKMIPETVSESELIEAEK